MSVIQNQIMHQASKEYFEKQEYRKNKNKYFTSGTNSGYPVKHNTNSSFIYSDSSEILETSENIHKETDQIIKLCIYNINGNSNELEYSPSEITCKEGTLGDIKHEEIHRIISMIKNLSPDELKNLPMINIPIYIFNITNTLTNGNKNEIKY